jgi:hypothetical protein
MSQYTFICPLLNVASAKQHNDVKMASLKAPTHSNLQSRRSSWTLANKLITRQEEKVSIYQFQAHACFEMAMVWCTGLEENH